MNSISPLKSSLSHYDSIIKFHFQHPSQKCEFHQATFDTTLNALSHNSKLLTPLYYTHLKAVGQKPIIKLSKRAIASFNVREGSPVGTFTSSHFKSGVFESYYLNLYLAFLPSFKRQGSEDPTITVLNINSLQLVFPITDLNFLYSFFLLPPIFYSSSNLGGANIGFSSKSNFKHFYPSIHKFFFSTRYIF
jgi:hypothetical protein